MKGTVLFSALITVLIMCGCPQAAQIAPETLGPSGDEMPALQPPSLLLITIDTLRADHLSTYGWERETTPFLTGLAGGGVVFDRAYSTSSWTVPAVVSMLTALWPTSHGIVHGINRNGLIYEQEGMAPGLATLAEQLQAQGYRTYAVLANGHLDEGHGFARGFDFFECPGFSPAEEVNAEFLEWGSEISEHSGPQFVWLHYFDPHLAYRPREPWLSRFDATITEEERVTFLEALKGPILRRMIMQRGPRYLDLAGVHYDSEIAYADSHIAKVFEAIPALDDFVVVLTSDHGEELLEHGHVGHGHNLYNETVRIPFIIRFPEGESRVRSTDVVSIVDVAPTLLALAGGHPPEEWHGRVLVDMQGKVVPGADRTVLADLARYWDKPHRAAAIGPRWKVVIRLEGTDAELYDLQADPGEQASVAVIHRQVAGDLRDQLLATLKGLPAPPPSPREGAVDEEHLKALRELGYIE
jgi:arylsulfatase A-like enzyme